MSWTTLGASVRIGTPPSSTPARSTQDAYGMALVRTIQTRSRLFVASLYRIAPPSPPIHRSARSPPSRSTAHAPVASDVSHSGGVDSSPAGTWRGTPRQAPPGPEMHPNGISWTPATDPQPHQSFKVSGWARSGTTLNFAQLGNLLPAGTLQVLPGL